MNHDPDSVKYIRDLTVLELKFLIRECLREFEEEKLRATSAGAEAQYKQLQFYLPS